MATYLFAWNPTKWNWTDLDLQIEQVALAGYADDRWSSGNTKKILPGSRFFLIQLGVERRGIIGSGTTLSAPTVERHWDPDKAALGVIAPYAGIRFDFLSRTPLVSWEDLQKFPFSTFRWGIQASGVRLPAPVAGALEQIWEKRAITAALPVTASIAASALAEGALRQVTVNVYERNPLARAASLAHHGSRCKICGTDLGDRFGPLANGFIHVHHITPLSKIGKTYQVDPKKDLVPVCPTCHAVMHLCVPPLSVAEVRALLKDAHEA